MQDITFSKQERELLAKKLQGYFSDELDQPLGQFDAEFLLDFIAEELGAYFYNRGLYDAQAILEKQLENLADVIYELEKPTDFIR